MMCCVCNFPIPSYLIKRYLCARSLWFSSLWSYVSAINFIQQFVVDFKQLPLSDSRQRMSIYRVVPRAEDAAGKRKLDNKYYFMVSFIGRIRFCPNLQREEIRWNKICVSLCSLMEKGICFRAWGICGGRLCFCEIWFSMGMFFNWISMRRT